MQLQTETQNVVYEIQKIEEQPIAESVMISGNWINRYYLAFTV